MAAPKLIDLDEAMQHANELAMQPDRFEASKTEDALITLAVHLIASGMDPKTRAVLGDAHEYLRSPQFKEFHDAAKGLVAKFGVQGARHVVDQIAGDA